MRNRTGFTLVELMLALGIGTVLLLAVYGVLASTLAAQESLNRQTEGSRRAAVLFDRMRRELAATTEYRDGEVAFVGVKDEQGQARLDFLTLAPRGRARGWPEEVGYRVLDGTLCRRESVYVDGEPTRGGSLIQVCRGVTGFTLRYWDGDTWQATWQERKELPMLFELTVEIEGVPFSQTFRTGRGDRTGSGGG